MCPLKWAVDGVRTPSKMFEYLALLETVPPRVRTATAVTRVNSRVTAIITRVLRRQGERYLRLNHYSCVSGKK